MIERTQHSVNLANSGVWCGEASLLAFGINKVTGRWQDTCWAIACCTLRDAGYDLEYAVAPWDTPVTLSKFIEANPTGSYIIQTANHTMALRDGKLTDTDLDATGRRKVTMAYTVSGTKQREPETLKWSA